MFIIFVSKLIRDTPIFNRHDITDLEAGTAIYARLSAHTRMSYGYSALSYPEFETPSNIHPGVPPAVRLWASTESSITVEWEHPTVDGGGQRWVVLRQEIDMRIVKQRKLWHGIMSSYHWTGHMSQEHSIENNRSNFCSFLYVDQKWTY